MEWKTSKTQVEYEEAVRFMEERVCSIIENREDELIWFLEHPHIYTAGSSASLSDFLGDAKAELVTTGRGGKITYHGPGQLVIYVMINLQNYFPDIRIFLQKLEEVVVNVLKKHNIKGELRENRVGIWVKEMQTESKIAAIGIRVKKWVTYHGVAINLNPDLEYFNAIVPCGIKEFGVTSFEKLGVPFDRYVIEQEFKEEFSKIFVANS